MGFYLKGFYEIFNLLGKILSGKSDEIFCNWRNFSTSNLMYKSDEIFCKWRKIFPDKVLSMWSMWRKLYKMFFFLFSIILQVFIHNPHKRLNLVGGRVEASQQSTSDVNLLNINQQVSSICCGSLDDSQRDLLFVGTPTNLLAYDVENNSDLFYNDVRVFLI